MIPCSDSFAFDLWNVPQEHNRYLAAHRWRVSLFAQLNPTGIIPQSGISCPRIVLVCCTCTANCYAGAFRYSKPQRTTNLCNIVHGVYTRVGRCTGFGRNSTREGIEWLQHAPTVVATMVSWWWRPLRTGKRSYWIFEGASVRESGDGSNPLHMTTPGIKYE